MVRRLKQSGLTGLRLALCGAALWLVVRGVSLHDTLTLSDANSVLIGRVTDLGQRYHVDLRDGGQQMVAYADVARDADGRSLISRGLLSVWQASGKNLLLAGVGVFLLVPLLQAIRLKGLLAAQGIALGQRESIRLAFIGNFLNFAAPLGSTAGDVYKAWYATRGTTRKTEAASIVFLDRVLGLVVLLFSVGFIAVLAGAESRLAVMRPYLLSLIGLTLASVVLWALPIVRNSSLVRTLADRLPQRERLARIDQTAQRMLSAWRPLSGAVGVTLLLQICAALSFACIGAALGLHLGDSTPLATYAYFSTGEIVKALPGPPQGLGTMELAYNFFFAGLGSPAQIVAAAFAMRLVNLICALPGVLFLAAAGANRRAAWKPQAAVADVRLASAA